MTPWIKQRWLEELRSGTYVQAFGALRFNTTEFCANGLLCELHSRSQEQPWNHNLRAFFPYDYLGHASSLPPAVEEWAGLTPEEWQATQDLNDDGKDFDWLADYIEKNL